MMPQVAMLDPILFSLGPPQQTKKSRDDSRLGRLDSLRHESERNGYNLVMRELLLICLVAVAAFAQTGRFGAFTNSDDVGAPPLKGFAEFDASTRQYKVTGTGADIWAKADQFHYLWRQM